jgi:hypothetical protein
MPQALGLCRELIEPTATTIIPLEAIEEAIEETIPPEQIETFESIEETIPPEQIETFENGFSQSQAYDKCDFWHILS